MANRDQQPLHVAVVVCQTRAALNWLVHVTFAFNPYGRVVNLCDQHIVETSWVTSTWRANIHGKVGKCVQSCWFGPSEVVGGRCCRLVKEPSRPDRKSTKRTGKIDEAGIQSILQNWSRHLCVVS
jgi:hypothetical protein